VPGVSLLFALVALLFTVGGGLALYALVRGERNQRTTTDRETAERLARRDTRDEDEGAEQTRDGNGPIEGNHWG